MAAVSIATTATRIDSVETGGSGSSLAIKNVGAATVYLGGADVTTASGFPLEPNESTSADLRMANVQVFGIVATGTVEVRTWELF